jgi:hypothetical protein
MSARAVGADSAVLVPMGAPQSPQYRLTGELPPPHAAQSLVSGDPQSPQKRLPTCTAVPQRGQSMPIPSVPDLAVPTFSGGLARCGQSNHGFARDAITPAS